jgi:transcriptional regulator with AAA-type ATPase domain/tetratricopeptide (TPR) repeat protein
VRIPTPAALLVEHPALPAPSVSGAVREIFDEGAVRIHEITLTRRDRFRLALQLTAAVAHLAEFDLWPARGAIGEARVSHAPTGYAITMGRFPYPLSHAIGRLGGGEGAMERLRDAAIQRIAAAVRLEPDEIGEAPEAPGLVFDGAVSQLQRENQHPVNRPSARALWALALSELPVSEAGVVQLWRVRRDQSARRLAGALWCRLRRNREPAWLWRAGDAGADTAPMPSLGERGTLIVVGNVSQGELTALSRWSQRDGCSAVAIGTFPGGWNAPRPPFDSQRLARHISLVGMPPDRARRILDQRHSRFDPMEQADRDALSAAVHTAVTPRGRRPAPPRRSLSEESLASWLALVPGGLPPAVVALHSGNTMAELVSARAALGVIEHDGVWRLPEPVPLEVDPRHLLVASLIGDDSPARLLHTALGGADSSELEAWARAELDRLRAVGVHDLLSVIATGALGHGVQLLLAEASLSILDLGGARNALVDVSPRKATAHQLWLEAIDHRLGAPRRLPTDAEIRSHPRAAAEAAVIALHDARRRGLETHVEARAAVESALGRLSGEVRRRIELELIFIERPQELASSRKARDLVGDDPALRAQLAHRRALVFLDDGDTPKARRLLQVLSRSLIGPGLLGCVELDLGAIALHEGRSRIAAGHQLRAYQLLKTAGFEHLTHIALFDLAVADVDQLRVATAAQRLEKLAETDPNDPFVIGERARLALAVGDEPAFGRLLTAFEEAVDDDDPRFAEGLALLRGVAALLDGDRSRALSILQRAGQEGLAWQTLAAADDGRPIGSGPWDEWGVRRAAELVQAVRSGRGFEISNRGPSEWLAFALAERLYGGKLTQDAGLRGEAIRNLRSSGLVGWAEKLSGFHEHAAGLMTALARIVESGGVDGVEPEQLDLLIRSLEITGIEVLEASERRRIWRYGRGRPGSELRYGKLVVIPLGGDLVEGPARRLVLGILDLVLPPASGGHDPDIEETGFYGVSDGARSLRRELRELGPSHLPVLLTGETGVGKEVAARALHRLSGRTGALVTVNVAAIPGTLLEAELFGTVKGAFTGADRSRQGLAVAADGGTLFLDEIGDLDSGLQVKLLRFLESGEVRAVGAIQSRKVDVRIVSATHADLGRRMREGRFRRDLYFRIAAPEVRVPPLRSRREDVPLLKDLFERDAASRHGLVRPVWSSEAEAVLQRYHWPGNVRELRQVVEVAMVRAGGSVVQCDHLPISSPGFTPGGNWEEAQREFRRRYLEAALQRNGGNRSATARELGISRQTLIYHLRHLGLNRSAKG